MKNIKLICLFMLPLFFWACKKSAVYTDQLDQYKKIYIKQAAENPSRVLLKKLEDEQFLFFNIYYGGLTTNDKNIEVKFDVFPELVKEYNEKTSSNYEVLPPDSYRLDVRQSVISPGKLSTELIPIGIRTNLLDADKSYLLPVMLTEISESIPINEELKVAYFLINTEYSLGEQPPTFTFDLFGRSIRSLFTYKDFLYVQEGAELKNYKYIPRTQQFDITMTSLNSGWNIFNQVLPYTNGVIGKWDGTGVLREYHVDAAGTLTAPDFLDKGAGFNAYDKVAFSFHHNGLICRKPNGDIFLVRKTGAIWSNIIQIGSGFTSYVHIIDYRDGILAVNAAGDIYFYRLSADLQLSAPEHVGSGWNIYSRILSFGEDLLALKSDGKLMRYDFDLRGFWKVKN